MAIRGQKLYARAMRKAPTKFEALLWQELRGKKLAGLKFRRQHPIQLSSLSGKYKFFIADFCCVSKSMIIELDGIMHLSQADYDFARDGHLKELGFRILRIPNDMIEHRIDLALDLIRELSNT